MMLDILISLVLCLIVNLIISYVFHKDNGLIDVIAIAGIIGFASWLAFMIVSAVFGHGIFINEFVVSFIFGYLLRNSHFINELKKKRE